MFHSLNVGAARIPVKSWAEAVDLAAKHGFEGLDPMIGDAAVIADPAAAKAKLNDAGLKCGGAGLPVEFRADQAKFEDDLTKLPAAAKLAATLGSDSMSTYIMPFHDELDFDANFERHVSRLSRVATVLSDAGLKLALEFVGPKTLRDGKPHEFLHSIDGMLTLCNAIDAGQVGILLDSFHWHCTRASAADITNKLVGRVHYVHINDAREGRSPEEQVDNERAMPVATGVIDSAAFIGALRAIQYTGPVVAEPFLSWENMTLDEITAGFAAAGKKMLAMA